MNLIELLKSKWTIAGLDAPVFAWLAAILLLGVSVILIFWLWWFVRRESQIYREAIGHLKKVRSEYPMRPGKGLSASAYDAASQLFERTSVLTPAWRNFTAQIIRKRTATGDDEYWSPESADGSFSDAAVIEARLNRNTFMAIPGAITGIGLLVTFLAILVALLDVKLVNNRFEGLDFLIQGLSGKFISSIAALASAAIFLLCEKHLLHSLTKSRLNLVAAIDELVPRLSPVRVLASIHRDIAEQSEAFRHFNTDLSTKLKQSFNESMGPTLERMVQGVEDLNQLLRATEAQKQDSITGSLETLLRNLENSISSSLEQMTTRFSESLSGSTMRQFDRVADSLGG